MFVVMHTAVDYHAPARLDDELKLTVAVERLGRASVQFFQQAWRLTDGQPQLLCTGRIRVGCVDTETLRPGAIPTEVLAKIQTNPA
jgi:acyl-CoA thioester hydrolase